MSKIFIGGDLHCQPESSEYKIAEEIGYGLAKKGFTIVSSAYMGASKAAFHGAIRGNDNSRRIALDCSEIELERNASYTEIVIADNYFDMKMKSCINSDAFVFLPGSFDVLSMLAIVLQLKQLKLMGKKPTIFVGEQLEEMLNSFGFYNEDVIDYFNEVIFLKDAAEAISQITSLFEIS
jgi:predicted Rossmann-fold nucleotide-binding protein